MEKKPNIIEDDSKGGDRNVVQTSDKFCTGRSSDLPFGPQKIMTTFKPSDDQKKKTKKKRQFY